MEIFKDDNFMSASAIQEKDRIWKEFGDKFVKFSKYVEMMKFDEKPRYGKL